MGTQAIQAFGQLDRIRSRAVARICQFRERWRGYEIYLSALLIFGASRVVVIIGVRFGALLARTPDPAQWDAGKAWYYRLLRWDSGWYASIINNGYQYSDNATVQGSTAFYPLYPLASYAVKNLFGVDEYLALLLVANVASLAVAFLWTRLAKQEMGSDIALLSLAFFCFFPSSLFLSAGYAESLCLMFILLSFIMLFRGNFPLAAILAALSLGTRMTGIVMIPVILWEMWRQNNGPWSSLLVRMALCSVLAASGLLLYAGYLAVEFGHPFAFATSQAAWHTGTFFDRLLAAATLHPFRYSSSQIVGLFTYFLTSLFVCFLVLAFWSFWRMRSALSLYALGVLLLPYLTLGITGSINRFVLMCFPAFMCLGALCRGRWLFSSVLIAIFSALLVCETALFSQWYRVG